VVLRARPGRPGPDRIELTFEVDSADRWRCTRLTVESHDVTAGLLEALQLADLTTAAVFDQAMPYDRATGKARLVPHDDRRALFREGARRRTRSRITRDRLEEVADVYRSALGEGSTHPVEVVRDKLGIGSASTAAKYVMRAREAGLLPPTTRGKAQA
jgi:hypothetical protein